MKWPARLHLPNKNNARSAPHIPENEKSSSHGLKFWMFSLLFFFFFLPPLTDSHREGIVCWPSLRLFSWRLNLGIDGLQDASLTIFTTNLQRTNRDWGNSSRAESIVRGRRTAIAGWEFVPYQMMMQKKVEEEEEEDHSVQIKHSTKYRVREL